MNSLKIGLIIPVYNVEKTIDKVLNSIVKAELDHIHEILFIDNDSHDQTIQKIQDHIRNNFNGTTNIKIVKHANNYGYGCSVKAGFEYFLCRPVSHVMLMHGDYQVDPAWLITSLTSVVKAKSDVDVVLGSRFKKGSNTSNYSGLRILGNYFFNVMTYICSGCWMSDAGTAMIIIRKDVLQKVYVETLSNSWQFHPQLNLLLYKRHNIKIEEVPIAWSDSAVNSTLPLFSYGITLLKMLIGYWFKKNILRRPNHMLFPHNPMPIERKFIEIVVTKPRMVPPQCDDLETVPNLYRVKI